MTRSPPQVQGNPERVIETSAQFGGKVCHYRLGVKECVCYPMRNRGHFKAGQVRGDSGAPCQSGVTGSSPSSAANCKALHLALNLYSLPSPRLRDQSAGLRDS